MGSDFFNKLTEASSETAVKSAKMLMKNRLQVYLLRNHDGSINAAFCHKKRYDRVVISSDGLNNGECSCGDFRNGKICCHAVAAILSAGSQEPLPQAVNSDKLAKYAGLQYHELDTLTSEAENRPLARLFIQSENEFPHVPSKWEKALFKVRLCSNDREYTGNLGNMRDLHFNKRLLASLKLEYFSLQERQIIRFLAVNAEVEGARLALGAELAAEFLHCLIGYENFTRGGRRVIIHEEHARPAIAWHQAGGKVITRSALDINGFILPLTDAKVIMGRAGCWVGMKGEYWWTAATVDISWMRSLLRAKPQDMPLAESGKWLKRHEQLPITVFRTDKREVAVKQGRAIFSASINDDNILHLQLSYCYDNIVLPADEKRIELGKDGYWQRDTEFEMCLKRELTNFGFVDSGSGKYRSWSLDNPEAIGAFFDVMLNKWRQDGLDFMLTSAAAALSHGGCGVPELTAVAGLKEKLSNKYVIECIFTVGKSKLTWHEAVNAARENCNYIITPEHEIIRLSSAFKNFMRGLANVARAYDNEPDLVAIPHTAIYYWCRLGAEVPGLVPDDFTGMIHALDPADDKKITGHEVAPRKDRFRGELRSYQREGLDWLRSMTSNGFNVILADEMGLGKTIQALALIAEQSTSAWPSLVVCPSSLLDNWQRESEIFIDGVKALIITGTKRKALWAEAVNYDLVIASYTIVKRDVETIKQLNFSYMILDEAQHIKNPSTVNAKSCKDIRAEHKIVLTGTPLENSSSDLWSIFDFLSPGLLGSFNGFKKYYADINEDRFLQEDLAARVGNFILRRTKDKVCDDLPPKIEQIIYCEMAPDQRKLYNEIFNYGQRLVAAYDKNKKQNSFEILTTLLRLRQICCNPQLLPDMETVNVSSAKTDLLKELVLENIDSGHKMLIFSQFTSLLKIIRTWLDESEISYEYLDGASKKRQAIVDNFNNTPEIPVFLLSLKAGGVGLNLTSADTVIIFDPWWNPAVEDQATDRTHRIGQTRTVNSIKLVMEDSIEEKILQLKSRKQKLFDNLIENPSANAAKLNIEDLKFLFK
jgi:superfamily II DNA or RNA helicase